MPPPLPCSLPRSVQMANKDANKKQVFSQVFCVVPYFLKVHLNQFSYIKSKKNSRDQGFFLLFLMEGSGSIQNNDGCGSVRPPGIHAS